MPVEFDADFFCKNLMILRRDRGLTQEGLAVLIGETRGKIGQYEAGNNFPPLPVLVKLANALKISLDKLVVGKESEFYPIDQEVVDAVAGHVNAEQDRYHLELKHKTEVQEVQLTDMRRELGTLRAYTARLEKDLAKYENEERGKDKKAG